MNLAAISLANWEDSGARYASVLPSAVVPKLNICHLFDHVQQVELAEDVLQALFYNLAKPDSLTSGYFGYKINCAPIAFSWESISNSKEVQWFSL